MAEHYVAWARDGNIYRAEVVPGVHANDALLEKNGPMPVKNYTRAMGRLGSKLCISAPESDQQKLVFKRDHPRIEHLELSGEAK